MLIPSRYYSQKNYCYFKECEDDMARWFLASGEWTGDIVEKPNNQRLIIDRKLKAFGETWTDGYKVVVRRVCNHKQKCSKEMILFIN